MTDPRVSFASSLAAAGAADVLAILGGTVIRIRIGRHAIETSSGQILIFGLSTLTARLFDRVVVEGDETVQVHPRVVPGLGAGDFIERLRTVITTIRPVEAAHNQ